MDIFKVIKEKKATLLLMNLAISSFKNRMAEQFGVKPASDCLNGHCFHSIICAHLFVGGEVNRASSCGFCMN